MARTYKDSGIPWIGEIPQEWDVRRIKYVLSESKARSTTGVERPLSLTADKGLIPSDEKQTKTAQSESFIGSKIVHNGEIVFNRFRSRLFAKSVYDGVVSPDYAVFHPKDNIVADYITALLNTKPYRDAFNQKANGIGDGFSRLYTDDLFSFQTLLPPFSEQQRIAEFLDRKCDEIDELIGLQGEFIEELKAYKQSLITETVTRGLNPNAKLKPSGIDWIGEIPENAHIEKLGHLIEGYKAGPFGSSLITGNLLTEGRILVYTPEHIAKGTTECDGNLYLQEERLEDMSQFVVCPNDIIFPIVGSLGRAMVIKSDMPVGIINQRLSKFSLKKNKLDEGYFMWIFGKSSFYEPFINLYCRGAIIVNLTKEIVRNMPVVVFPIEEQQQIADYLDSKCSEIDSLIAIKQQKIEELKDYKKSIIYEYVSGKREIK